MKIKYIDFDPRVLKQTFSKYTKQGYTSDGNFADRPSAEIHIRALYNQGKDVIVLQENKTIRWYVMTKEGTTEPMKTQLITKKDDTSAAVTKAGFQI